MGIPGCYAAVLLADRMGCKRLNTYGFLLLSAAFAGQAIAWMLVPEAHILQFAPWFVLKSLIDRILCIWWGHIVFYPLAVYGTLCKHLRCLRAVTLGS